MSWVTANWCCQCQWNTNNPESRCWVLSRENDPGHLRIQLLLLPDAINTAFAGTAIRVKMVTHVRTIVDSLNRNKIVEGMLREVDKLLWAYLTFPVTNATTERSFSSLRWIKSFLRGTMTQQHLNNLFMLYVQTTWTDSLDLVSVAKEFVAANSCRLNYFGKF